MKLATDARVEAVLKDPDGPARMGCMTVVAKALDPALLEDPMAPDEASWRAMSPQQRQRFIEQVHAAFEERRDLMTEGRPHFRVKSRAMDTLGRFFRRAGRRVYLASEVPVLYPGERIVHPDLMAVLDVEDLGDDDRASGVGCGRRGERARIRA